MAAAGQQFSAAVFDGSELDSCDLDVLGAPLGAYFLFGWCFL